jgi:hypothetical protein
MSHIATIEIEVKDLNALEAAAKDLGLVLKRDQETFRWYGTPVGNQTLPVGFRTADYGKCDHAIGFSTDECRPFPGLQDRYNHLPYEIGVCRRRDGKPGYVLLWDPFLGGFGLESAVGKNAVKLTQRYAVQVAKRHMAGAHCHEIVRDDGSIRLEFTRQGGF